MAWLTWRVNKMPWLIVGGIVFTSVFYTGSQAAEKTTDLAKWVTIGGSIFVAYKVSKSSGWIK